MERKFLEDLGLEKDVINQIMKQNGEDIESAKAKDKSAELESELESMKEQLKDRNAQLTALKDDKNASEELKNKIAELEEQNKKADAEHAAEIKAIKLDAAVSKAITASHAKNSKAVKALLDLDSLKMDKDGNVSGLDEQIKNLKEAEDSKFLFEDEGVHLRGAEPADPTDNSNHTLTFEEFSKMNYTDRAKLHADAPETYEAMAAQETAE